MKSYFMAVKGYGQPVSRVPYSFFKYCLVDHFATRFFISTIFPPRIANDSSTNLIYLRIMAKECRRRIRRFSYVAISEINLMRFFCRGEIRRGKISRDIAREFLSCSCICSINFFYVILRYVVNVGEIETFS